MRTLMTELKRMFYEKKMVWLLGVTVIYVMICCSFRWLRYQFDYHYDEMHYNLSAFYLWQMNMDESFMTVLMKIMPSLVYGFSFMDDQKNGIDNQICIKNHSNIYYKAKYITVITGGMLYNFLSVILIYFPIYFCLSTGNRGWNYLDRSDALVGRFFIGSTAIEFILLIAVCYAFVGGVCSAMSYVMSMWIDNRVLICIMPYIIFKILEQTFIQRTRFINIIIGEVDTGMSDKPFIFMVYYFVWWILFLSILLITSYTVNIEKKR